MKLEWSWNISHTKILWASEIFYFMSFEHILYKQELFVSGISPKISIISKKQFLTSYYGVFFQAFGLPYLLIIVTTY